MELGIKMLLASLLDQLPSALSTSCVVAITVLLTTYISYKIFQNRTSRILREAETQWASRKDKDTSILIESIPSGWFNILMAAVWPSLLERFCAKLATERLERAFERRIKSQKGKFPWRHLARVEVEHVTLGLTPPQFQLILAKFDPANQTLKLEADMKWTTSAFQIVLSPVIHSPIFPKTRFLLSNLDISGRISATLTLCSQQPGVKFELPSLVSHLSHSFYSRVCEVSFLGVPSIDMRVTPLGMALKDFPGIPESLRRTIVKLLTKGMVHPRKITLDVCKIYETLRMKQRGGIGGLLTVNLSSASGFCASTTGTAEMFCECTFGKHVFRTPIRNGTESVHWDWNCGIRLDDKLPSLLDHEMSIKLFSAKSLGEPTLLAHGKLSLRDVGLEALHSGIVSKSVSLESHMSSHQPVMHLTFQLSAPAEVDSADSSCPNSKQKDKEAPTEATDPPSPFVEMQKGMPLTNSASMPVLRDGERLEKEVYTEKVEAIEAALARLSRNEKGEELDPDATFSQLQLSTSSTDSLRLLAEQNEFLESYPESQATLPIASSMLPGRSDGGGQANGFVNLLHVTQFDEMLRRDRLLYKQQLAEMQSQVSCLEKQLMAEQNRRLDEGLKSLTEGAYFIVHKRHERASRQVWYDPSSHTLNWASGNLSRREVSSQMWPIKSQSLYQISEIRKGTQYFPKQTFFGLGAVRSFLLRKVGGQVREEPALVEENCFSILSVENKALNLQVPSGGNGRSRDAWVDTLESLIRRKEPPKAL